MMKSSLSSARLAGPVRSPRLPIGSLLHSLALRLVFLLLSPIGRQSQALLILIGGPELVRLLELGRSRRLDFVDEAHDCAWFRDRVSMRGTLLFRWNLVSCLLRY